MTMSGQKKWTILIYCRSKIIIIKLLLQIPNGLQLLIPNSTLLQAINGNLWLKLLSLKFLMVILEWKHITKKYHPKITTIKFLLHLYKDKPLQASIDNFYIHTVCNDIALRVSAYKHKHTAWRLNKLRSSQHSHD